MLALIQDARLLDLCLVFDVVVRDSIVALTDFMAAAFG